VFIYDQNLRNLTFDVLFLYVLSERVRIEYFHVRCSCCDVNVPGYGGFVRVDGQLSMSIGRLVDTLYASLMFYVITYRCSKLFIDGIR